MENIFNVLIVGAGKIGAFFDRPGSENILTHAHAFSTIRGFRLIGFVDLEDDKVENAAKLWETKAFKSIEDAFSKQSIDIICVCVPDKYHYEVLKRVSNFPIKLVFAEKPLAKTLEQAEEIIEIYKKKEMNCLVNYSRRFVPEFESVKSKIISGHYGKFICGNGYYGKGTLHNGSHLVDFLRYFIGEINTTKTFNHNYDFYNDDPSVSTVIGFKNGGFFTILNVPCENFTIFEIDLMFEKSRVKILDSGFKLEIYEVSDSELFNGYSNLIKSEEYKTSLGNAMGNAALNIYNHLSYNEELKCSLEDGYEAMVICEKLKVGIYNE